MRTSFLAIALLAATAGFVQAAQDPALKQSARAYRDMQQLCAALPTEARDTCLKDTRERYVEELADARLPVVEPVQVQHKLPWH